MNIRLKNWLPYTAFVGLVAICVAIVALGQTPLAGDAPAPADPQEVLRQLGRRNIRVHDPSAIVKCKNEYWIFFTGAGPPSIHSTDMVNWTAGPRPFTSPLPWVAQAVPGAHLDQNQIVAFMTAAAVSAMTAGWKWLQGWQQHEALVAQGRDVPVKAGPPAAATAAAPVASQAPVVSPAPS